MRRLIVRPSKRAFILAATGVLVAAGAALGAWNLPASGHSSRADVTAVQGDDGGDSDGGPAGPWIGYYDKESSGRPITPTLTRC